MPNKQNKTIITTADNGNKKYIVPVDLKKHYNNVYYEKHKERVLEKMAEKVVCDNCGRTVSQSFLSKHKKTARCVNHVK